MRILLTADPEICVPPEGYGGIERIVDALARSLSAGGHEVGLVARGGSSCPVAARFAWPAEASRGWGNTLRNGMALARAVREFRPELLHSFSRLAYLLPLLPTRLPKIMSYQRHTGGRQVRVAGLLAGASLRFTGCSEFICGQGRSAGGSWTAVHNFVEPEKFTFVPSVPNEAPLVFLSRMDRIKGPHLAIAIARASGRRLILAGNHAASGPDHEYWRNEVAPQIGRSVEWVGEVGDEAKNTLLGQAAALLVPIQWDEPFGIVFAEALACGTPVISCPRGALPEIVEDGVTGFLVNTREEGVAAVEKLGTLSRAACRRAAEERFSVGAATDRYVALYRRMGARSA
jgi:glycosyltransferase involved in cell wall biosynthesis